MIKTLVAVGATVAVGTANGAYLSANGGQTWTPAGLEGRIVYDFARNSLFGSTEIWAGTDTGVFSSKNSGSTWSAVGGGLPSVYTVSQGSDFALYAGTKENGIFRYTNGGWAADGLNGLGAQFPGLPDARGGGRQAAERHERWDLRGGHDPSRSAHA